MKTLIYVLLFALPSCLVAATSNNLQWPNNARAAVSLSYDDTLSSQVQNALPALKKYDLKGTFYLSPAAPGFRRHLDDWKQAAALGHELGNHTIYHACNATQHAWMPKEDDLAKRTVRQMVREVEVANLILHLLDGKQKRTFTAPCVDPNAADGDYTEGLYHLFPGIKTNVSSRPIPLSELNLRKVPIWAPVDVTGDELIAYVKKAAELNALASITFHGVGGDNLTVSTRAHNQLLAYLAANPKTYWTATFLDISQHVAELKGQQSNN